MFRSACALLSLIILYSASPVLADDQLSEILKGVRETYGKLSGLSLPYKREIITQSMTMLSGGTERDLATGQIYFKPPSSLKVQQDTPQPETIFSDGHTLWWVIPHKNEAHRYPSQEFGKELQLLNDIFHGLRAVEETFDVLVMGLVENGECRLKLTPNPAWPDIQHIQLSVSQSDYTIHVIEIHNYIGGITRFILGDYHVKETFSEDFFRFSPPDGVKIVEQATSS
jgi:outer membrane lipoprotein-sorting protein